MKKLALLLTTTLGVTAAINAQTAKTIDIGYYMSIDGATPNTSFTLPCNDSFTVNLQIVNHGPDPVEAGDSLLFAAPWSETGYVAVIVADTTYLAGDTIINETYNDHVNDIERLYEASSGQAKYKPFNDGEYIYAFLAAGVQNGVEHSDTITDNNETGALVTLTCGNSSINDLAKTTLNVYPNPASTSLNFTHNFNKTTAATVKVLDLMGRTVLVEQYDVNAGSKNFNIDVTGLANGSYFVELTTSEERGVTKFTVAK